MTGLTKIDNNNVNLNTVPKASRRSTAWRKRTEEINGCKGLQGIRINVKPTIRRMNYLKSTPVNASLLTSASVTVTSFRTDTSGIRFI